MTESFTFLRRIMALDAATCAVAGAGCLGLTQLAAGQLGMSSGVVLGLGTFLLGWTGLAASLATRRRPNAGLVWLVVAGNLVWAFESWMILVLGWVQPTTFGAVVLVGQGLAVGLVAALQVLGLRLAQAPARA